jgi:hypothetical protein
VKGWRRLLASNLLAGSAMAAAHARQAQALVPRNAKNVCSTGFQAAACRRRGERHVSCRASRHGAPAAAAAVAAAATACGYHDRCRRGAVCDDAQQPKAAHQAEEVGQQRIGGGLQGRGQVGRRACIDP